jgi:long-chain acyl-CoA synthetase
LLAPPQYWLTTALFNLFPLPRLAGFRRSFAHMGEAMDRGMSVLVFPEGRRSHNAVLAPFRPGIGLLAQESGASILPVVIRGMETLLEGKRWFHKGAVEIVIGTPVDVNGEVGAEAIARELHAVMERMLAG